MTYQQLSLFDDVRFGGGVNEKNLCVNEVTGFSALYDAWKYLVPDHGAECGIRFRGHLEQGVVL